MSSTTQVEFDWAETNAGQGVSSVAPATAANGAGRSAYLTDEEILGMDPPSSAAADYGGQARRGTDGGAGGQARLGTDGGAGGQARIAREEDRGLSDRADGSAYTGDHAEPLDGTSAQTEARATQPRATGEMPSWMAAAAADPQHGNEAAQLWREHQEFRAAFTSPEEARAVRELLPGGVRDALSLREATQSVERIDAALFSGDARAQAEVVSELARANPAAFRSLFAEAAKVLAGLGQSLEAGDRRQEAGHQQDSVIPRSPERPRNLSSAGDYSRETPQRVAVATSGENRPQNDNDLAAAPRTTEHEFDAAAYASFERATNDAVARDVRGSISDTLTRVLPEGVADGAARRIGEDIFQEIHRALAADRTLSEQIAAILQSRRFGAAEQQRVASVLAGRAKQLVPGVARRVIGEWTSSVLSTSRTKAARQAAAASRVDIAAPGGSRDSMPLRQMTPREVDYASMSDEEILGI